MAENPPYVNAYGKIKTLFANIQVASVPTKVSQDYLATVLEMRSSSDRALIPLLKRLGFIDSTNVPTQAYKDYRDKEQARRVMAERIRDAYRPIFAAHEYAWKLTKEQLTSKITQVTGAAADDPMVPTIVGTFMELCKLADFEAKGVLKREPEKEEEVPKKMQTAAVGAPLGLSYTIVLNLPATTEIEVFNAIFKSLKENILREE